MADSPKVGGTATRTPGLRPGQRGVVPDDVYAELPSRNHMEGCPMEDDPDSLDFWLFVPKTGPMTGQQIVNIRCVRCGGERAIELEALRAEQAAAEDDEGE